MEKELFLEKYWSKSDALLLPLTGLVKDTKYICKSYLFWEDYSIENYQLIIKFFHRNEEEFSKYCKNYVFKVMDKSGYLTELFTCDDGTIMILDISEWEDDIEVFLKAKYSKISSAAKMIIRNFHRRKDGTVPVHIYVIIEPFESIEILGNLSGIDYAAKSYGLNITDLRKVGELGSVYDKKAETLIYNCHKSVEE